MDDAWQSQDIAPSNSGISIPADAVGPGAAMVTDDPSWTNGAGGRSPRDRDSGRDGDRDRDRDRDRARERRSRSRSPGRDDRGPSGQHNPGNNLHVSGLSHKVDSRDLESAFLKIGRVQKASVMYDPHTHESRGFGFVTMESPEEADAAVSALNATELMGKIMTVEKARRGRARTPTPGRYYGPPKRVERPYDPRPHDSRYARDYDDRRSRRGADDYYRGGRDYGRDDYRDRDRDRGDRYRERYDRDRYDDRRH